LSCNPPERPALSEPSETWQQVLEQDLHLLGHRNWILVVDKAFPEQSSPGMKYIYVEQDLLPTLQHVLEKVESSTHVSPIIYSDKELSYIDEEQVAGIEEFRSEREKILAGKEVNTLLHDDVFKLLDESSSLFRTLVIKTNCTIPYTSVFLQLDCAYWGAEKEAMLRQKMSDQGN
jgi:D-ribose pyranose/furanose isomerase RbsD